MLSTRIKTVGYMAMYDFVWACNISLMLALLGLIKNSKLLIASSLIMISVD